MVYEYSPLLVMWVTLSLADLLAGEMGSQHGLRLKLLLKKVRSSVV
jgi:hypothetical protein